MAVPLTDLFASPVPNLGAVPGTGASRSRWRFVHLLGLVLPAAFLVILAGACFLWPLLYHVPPPVGGSIIDSNIPIFSPGHMLGTDPVGNDIMSRILYGGRVSLEVGVGTALIGFVIGGGLGTIAAYRGGITDAVIMRVLDVFIAFPSLVLAIAIAEALGPSELHVIWAISVFSIPAVARVARAATLKLREQTFMLASGLLGTKTRRILLRHILPNIFPQLVTFSLLGIGIAVILEGALSFLGLGVPPPGPSWGNMIAVGEQTLSSQPALVVVPSLFLLATVLALNLLGDALRKRWSQR